MIRFLAIVAVMLVLLPFDSGRLGSPKLVTSQRLPADVQQLTDQTWAAFLDAFPGKRGCIGSVALRLVGDVEGGAAQYRSAVIRIEIPTSPIRYPESLAHELGHHLERACGVEREIGRAFREAIGLSNDADWAYGQRWHERATEFFAETVVEIVNGERHTHSDLIELPDAAVELVEAWSDAPPRP